MTKTLIVCFTTVCYESNILNQKSISSLTMGGRSNDVFLV